MSGTLLSPRRPLSPHLQVWRWHVTMLASILTRMSGVGLYLGALLIVAWLAAAALGAETYDAFLAIAASPLGLVVWIGLTWALMYHGLAGLRHLIWDTGLGLQRHSANRLAEVSIWGSVILTVAFWAALILSGRVTL